MTVQVQEMAEQCAASGISIKYGKKVLGRLEKVGPVRQELREAMQGEGDFKRLHAAVEEARGLRRSAPQTSACHVVCSNQCGKHSAAASSLALNIQGRLLLQASMCSVVSIYSMPEASVVEFKLLTVCFCACSLLQPDILSEAETQLAVLQKDEDARMAAQQAAALLASKAHPALNTAAKSPETVIGNGAHAHVSALARPALIHSHPPRLPQRPLNSPRPAYRPLVHSHQPPIAPISASPGHQPQPPHQAQQPVPMKPAPLPQPQYLGPQLSHTPHHLHRQQAMQNGYHPGPQQQQQQHSPQPQQQAPQPPRVLPFRGAPAPFAPPSSAPQPLGMQQGQYSLFGGSGGGGGFPGVRLDTIASRQPSPKPLPLASSAGRRQAQLPAFFPEALDNFPPITAVNGKAEADLVGGASQAECLVCMAAHKEICCIPCGHVSMCGKCAEEVKRATGMCPLCRGPIQCLLHIPRASDWPQGPAM